MITMTIRGLKESSLLESSGSLCLVRSWDSCAKKGSVRSRNLNLLKMGEMLFSMFDYVLFGGMLVLSALVGIYFGFCSETKQDNPMEYLLGSKSMKILPVAISLTAT